MIGQSSPRFDKYSHPFDVMTAILPGWRMVSDNSDGKLNADIINLVYRRPILQVYDNYLHNAQYRGLPKRGERPKNTTKRDFEPEFVFPLPMITAREYKNHIVSEDSRLNFVIEEEETQEKVNDLVEDICLWPILDSILPSYFVNGSMFLYFRKRKNGQLELKFFNTKSCWPVFDDDGELDNVKIRYIYETEEVNPSTRQKIWRWYQYKFSKDSDVTYDNPVFELSQTTLPEFKIKEMHNHNMGFVAGEWIKTTFNFECNDGESILENKLDFLDSMNFMLSSIYVSTKTNLFPPLFGQNVDPVDILQAIQKLRSAGLKSTGSEIMLSNKEKTDLRYIEPALTGLANAFNVNEKFMENIQHAFSTVLLNPEAVAPHANSGRALESLYKPVVQYVNCRRPLLKKGLCNLLEKIETQTDLAPGTFLNAKKQWGSIFSDTIDDQTKKISNVLNAHAGGLISLETALANIEQDFNIKNVQDELKKIKSEQQEQRKQEFEDQQLINNMQNQNQGEQQTK